MLCFIVKLVLAILTVIRGWKLWGFAILGFSFLINWALLEFEEEVPEVAMGVFWVGMTANFILLVMGIMGRCKHTEDTVEGAMS